MNALRTPLMPFSHIRVLDLSRVLAGPWATQLLADFGAEVIKVENPKGGDDTRQWGPPYLKYKATGEDIKGESAYYHCVNRNKKSITLDFQTPEGQETVRKLASKSDVVIENFKAGKLKEYGLAYDDLKKVKPDIIYASVTGFGQTGPRKDEAGYDFAIQAMGGLMSITGEPSSPVKVGVAITDIMTGMYTASAVMAALAYRDRHGEGQYIDVSLMDVQTAFLANQGMNYLVSGKPPVRMGNSHPNVAPYDALECADGFFVLAVGNDRQFIAALKVFDLEELELDHRFKTNAQRVKNRETLKSILVSVLKRQSKDYWMTKLREAGVPCSPINNIAEVIADPQIQFRQMKRTIPHANAGEVPTISNPVKFSLTPVEHYEPSPSLGEHNHLLQKMLEKK